MQVRGRRWLIGSGFLLAGLLLPAAATTPSAAGQAGWTDLREVTFSVRAGERISDLADRWQEMGISSRSTVAAVAGGEAFARFPLVPPPRPEACRFEGLFWPGSYTFRLPERSAAESPESYRYRSTVMLITTLLERAAAVEGPVRPQHGLSSYQLLILASIVQKEAAAGTDYRMVASVFFNRLAEQMRLSSCPTLEYALGYHRPFLTRKDLELDSPYNTYRYTGLPPTPIAFFSPEALAAVQHPAPSDYLFFVFDWTKPQLLFARTPPEHERQAQQAQEEYVHKYGLAELHRKYPGLFYRQVGS
jgi:cell division protein YceG involved in septum cleavage